MIIEVRKAGFVNKGAELMLYAIIQQIRSRYPDAKLVMAPTHSGGTQPFEKLTRLGFYPKSWLWRYGIQWGDLAVFLPKKLREMYGIVLDKEVTVVIDAAGFSYSDQWGYEKSRELAKSSDRWKKNRTKIILLPQALGPFHNHDIQPWIIKMVENVDLIFPRETDSYRYLTELVGERDKIKVFPDFTNLVEGELPIDYNPTDKRVAIIPNYRMIDKTTKEQSDAYLPFMISCASYLLEHDAKPFILIHEGDNDRVLAEKISENVGGIPIVKETNPLYIKGIIGSCDATIGSRFHGLVSALSQGIPSLSTGWSHKYKKLFDDYDFSEGMVDVEIDYLELSNKLNMLLDRDFSESIKKNLLSKSEDLKLKTKDMWQLVFHEIEKNGVKY